MAMSTDKFNLEGMAIDKDNNLTVAGSVTAEGGFVGKYALVGASAEIGSEYTIIDVINPTESGISITFEEPSSAGLSMKILVNAISASISFTVDTDTITFTVGETGFLELASTGSSTPVWRVFNTDGAIS